MEEEPQGLSLKKLKSEETSADAVVSMTEAGEGGQENTKRPRLPTDELVNGGTQGLKKVKIEDASAVAAMTEAGEHEQDNPKRARLSQGEEAQDPKRFKRSRIRFQAAKVRQQKGEVCGIHLLFRLATHCFPELRCDQHLDFEDANEPHLRLAADLMNGQLQFCIGGGGCIPLNDTQADRVKAVWAGKSLTFKNSATISAEDIRRLKPGKGKSHWVNSALVNTFTEILQEAIKRKGEKGILICNSFFHPKSQQGEDALLRWFDKLAQADGCRYKQVAKILVPVNSAGGSHWGNLVFNVPEQIVYAEDSLGLGNTLEYWQVGAAVSECLAARLEGNWLQETAQELRQITKAFCIKNTAKPSLPVAKKLPKDKRTVTNSSSAPWPSASGSESNMASEVLANALNNAANETDFWDAAAKSREMRAGVQEHLKNSPADVKSFLAAIWRADHADANPVSDEQAEDAYIETMAQDGQWGGDVELNVMAERGGYTIMVYEHPFKGEFRLRTQFGTGQSNSCLFLLRSNVDQEETCHYSALIPKANRLVLDAALAVVNTQPILLELPYGPGTEMFYAFGTKGDGNCMFAAVAFLELCLQQCSTKGQTTPRDWVRNFTPAATNPFETTETLARVLNGAMARAQRNLAITSSAAYDESSRASVLQLLELWRQLGCPLDEGSILCDGGVGIGVFLLWAADATGCIGIGVEQDPGPLDSLHLIQEALHENGWTGRVSSHLGKMHEVKSFEGSTHFMEYRGYKATLADYRNLQKGATAAEDLKVWENLFQTTSLRVWSSTKASPQILAHLAKTSRAIRLGLCEFRCVKSPSLHFAHNTFTLFTYVRLPTSRQDILKEIPEGPVKEMITFAGLQTPTQPLAYCLTPDQLPGGTEKNPYYRRTVTTGGWQVFGGSGLIILTRGVSIAPGSWVEFRVDSPAIKEAVFFGTANLQDRSNLVACVYDPDADRAFFVPYATIIGKIVDDDYAPVKLLLPRLKELIKEKLTIESGADTLRRSARKQEKSVQSLIENRQLKGATLHCLFLHRSLSLSHSVLSSTHIHTRIHRG